MNTPPNSRRQPAYGERARSYERDTAAFQPYRRAVVEALPLRSGHVVLDVGCGTGLCCGLLRDKVGPGGGVVGIEESPEMAAVAREHIACAGWDNVTVVQAPAEDAEIGPAADAALFCAVHDILPMMVALNSMVSLLHAPYVRDFSGFDRPWRHLEQLVEDVQVRELAFGSGYVMTGRTPASKPG
jgi:demethylmenaquinone methyltransferase/2-methoxy-6-polyprenyl-1,4-benzoquinol methylase